MEESNLLTIIVLDGSLFAIIAPRFPSPVDLTRPFEPSGSTRQEAKVWNLPTAVVHPVACAKNFLGS